MIIPAMKSVVYLHSSLVNLSGFKEMKEILIFIKKHWQIEQ